MAKPFDLDTTQFEVLDKRLTRAKLALRESATALSNARGETVTVRDVENGLVIALGLDEIFDLLHREIDTTEILSLLSGCDFSRLRPETLCDVVLDESLLPPDMLLFLSEAEVKLRGERWRVNKYDADPFPSNPHAHNYEQRLKLHLGNGDLYQHKEKVSCRRMEKKHLLMLRRLVVQKNATITLPPPLGLNARPDVLRMRQTGPSRCVLMFRS